MGNTSKDETINAFLTNPSSPELDIDVEKVALQPMQAPPDIGTFRALTLQDLSCVRYGADGKQPPLELKHLTRHRLIRRSNNLPRPQDLSDASRPASPFTPCPRMRPAYARRWPTQRSCRRFFRYEYLAGTSGCPVPIGLQR